jgi:hypothetical protein
MSESSVKFKLITRGGFCRGFSLGTAVGTGTILLVHKTVGLRHAAAAASDAIAAVIVLE